MKPPTCETRNRHCRGRDCWSPTSTERRHNSHFLEMMLNANYRRARRRAVNLLIEDFVEVAKVHKTINYTILKCYLCKKMLSKPVAASCGHSVCFECAAKTNTCKCEESGRIIQKEDITTSSIIQQLNMGVMRQVPIWEEDDLHQSSRRDDPLALTPEPIHNNRAKPNAVMSLTRRLKWALYLALRDNYVESVPHLVRVIAESSNYRRRARNFLSNMLQMLNITVRDHRLIEYIRQRVRNQSTESWICRCHIQCGICLETLSFPKTISCGHTFCHLCIRKLSMYNLRCPVCRNQMGFVDLCDTSPSYFITSVLDTIREHEPANNEFYILDFDAPAFPKVACPLLVYNPKYLHMIFHALYSGRPYLALVNFTDDNTDRGVYGTLIKICDQIFKHDGTCILTTIGIYRFQLIKRTNIQGFDAGLIMHLTDDPYTNWQLNAIYGLAMNTYSQAVNWYQSLHPSVKFSIETTYGKMPSYSTDLSNGGPEWLWWLTIIAPLKNEIKNLMLATKSIYKRLLVIIRTLDIILKHSLHENFQPSELRNRSTES